MLKHIPHIEDLIFDGQFIQAFDVINDVDEALRGQVVTGLNISTKYDGAPAIVFGYHPSDGRRFIGTKSVFNKRHPRIAYSIEDIDRLYPGDVGVKLRHVWDNLVSFPLGIWMADLMWYPGSTKQTPDFFSFTPNTITYSITHDDYDYEYMRRCNVGLCVHSFLSGEEMHDLQGRPIVEYDFIRADWYIYPNDVYFIRPTYKMRSFVMQAGGHLEMLSEHLDVLDGIDVQNVARMAYARVQNHSEMLKLFVNYCVRIGEPSPSIDMYRVFLKNREELQLATEVDADIQSFEALFAVHERIAAAKKLILEILSSDNRFLTTINGEPTSGEGFVVTYYGVPVKLVNRLEFSRHNFMNKRFENA